MLLISQGMDEDEMKRERRKKEGKNLLHTTISIFLYLNNNMKYLYFQRQQPQRQFSNDFFLFF